ncbi:MAG: glutathione S-transferase [Panacagrimonas sp.]|jgi:glutathione S-transferase|nr:glutathione S-transferase [Panacagrimonas sp.]MCC2657485.1 glutathione S-transferase [Panacagrimonas sp.]
MITIHHLGISQSDRIVWLMEELGLPYKLKWYHRGENRLAPPEFLALHPAATAPVIEDDGRMYAESAVILEHICHRHAGGKFTVGPSQPNYEDYLYWMHFNNNVLGLFFGKHALSDLTVASPNSDRMRTLIQRREDAYYRYLDQRLAASPYLAGPEFTCADIMTMFIVAELPLFGGRASDDLPHVKAYAERIGKRPAYQKAMAVAGPAAQPPAN